jgi:hypothetical protein
MSEEPKQINKTRGTIPDGPSHEPSHTFDEHLDGEESGLSVMYSCFWCTAADLALDGEEGEARRGIGLLTSWIDQTIAEWKKLGKHYVIRSSN